jgi:hypothetical protein
MYVEKLSASQGLLLYGVTSENFVFITPIQISSEAGCFPFQWAPELKYFLPPYNT